MDVGIPNEKDRGDILRAILNRFRHALTDTDVDLVANRTHGYVGADLESLCRESALHVLQRVRAAQRRGGGRGAGGCGGAAAGRSKEAHGRGDLRDEAAAWRFGRAGGAARSS